MPVTLAENELVSEIVSLKEQRRAVILAHNYQKPEVQEIADFTGDSLGLSLKARDTDAELIVFCGVYFMAETASILNPHKKVLLPDLLSGCSMADMISVDILLDLKEKHPSALVCSYVNTTADIKAESDICCTSSNAVEVVQSLPADREVIFVPDKYLGRFVEKQSGRKMILYDGWCPIHTEINEYGVAALKREHPEALVVAHPEAPPEVTGLADAICSTEQMARFCKSSQATAFIIATETGILHKLRRENPTKRFYAANDLAICPHMKKNDLEKILQSLQTLSPEVKVPESIRERAWKPIQKMLDLQLPYKENFWICKC